MLPFSIMNQYGNVIKTNNIKKVQGNALGGLLVLTKTGDLWVKGSNYANHFGMSTTSDVLQWTLSLTNVRDIFTGAQGSFAILNSGEIMYTGKDNILRNNTTFTAGWVDYTSGVSGGYNGADIKKLQVGNGTAFILANNGTLMVIGNNINGEAGDGSARNTFKALRVVAGSVRDVNLKNVNSSYISTAGQLYVSGSNSNYALGYGSDSNITTFSQIKTIPGNVVQCITGNYGTSVITENSGAYSLYVCGTNINGNLGINDSSGTTAYTSFRLHPTFNHSVLHSRSLELCGVSSCASPVLGSTGMIQVTGDNRNGQLGTGDKTNVLQYTAAQGVPAGADFKAGEDTFVAQGGTACTLVISGGAIYGTGVSSVFNLNSTVYVELESTLPF